MKRKAIGEGITENDARITQTFLHAYAKTHLPFNYAPHLPVIQRPLIFNYINI